MTDPVITTLLVLVSFLVGGNNAAVAVGTVVGSRIIRRSTGLLIVCIGYAFGLGLEGSKLQLLRSELFPGITETSAVLILIVASLVFSLASLRRIPASLTYALVGSIVGLALASGGKLNLTYLGETTFLWLFGPIAILFLSVSMARLAATRRGSFWGRVQVYRGGLILAGFFTAYALGANTLGAILSVVSSNGPTNLVAVAVGSAAGALILGRGPISRLGRELYALGYSSAFLSQTLGAIVIELSTQFGIPLSASRVVTSSTIGVGLSRPVRILNPRSVYIFFAEWFAVPGIAFVLSFCMGRLLNL